jgi:hypothetical protein
VVEFHPGPPATVDVQVATKERVQVVQRVKGVQQTQTTDLKLKPLLNVPISMSGGGGWTLTFPIQPGDECWIAFSDTALDVWLQNGGSDNVQVSQRRHSLSDGIAVVGWRSTPRGLASYARSSVQLRNDAGDSFLDITDGQVTVSGNLKVGNGWTGVFSTSTGKVVTVDGGVIYDVA